MSRNCPLSTQTSKHFVVIRNNREYPIGVLTKYLNVHYSEWVLICHKEDKDPITKMTIPVHYHYVGNSKKRDQRLSTSMNNLAKYLKCDIKGLSFDKYNNLDLSIQYLIHKNNPEKTQHDIKELLYNGWSEEDITNIILCEESTISFDKVYTLCKTYRSLLDVIRDLGFKQYHKYRNTIKDIWELTQYQKEKLLNDGVIDGDIYINKK